MALFEDWLLTALYWGSLGFAAWAFIDAVARPTAAFVVAEKLTKPGWMLITGVSSASLLIFRPLSIFGIIALVAIGVYLTDVRPAVRSIGRGDHRW